MTDLAANLRKHTQGEVLFSDADRARYATDASIYQQIPVGVFVPKTADDIKNAIDVARDAKVPVLARGGGTSQCGQTTGVALVIDDSKYFRNVINFDAQKRTVSVEPGMVLDHLNAFLKPHGLWFPVDVSTSAQATLGGMAGNNSCGSRSIAYGNMVHNVLGAEAWLADSSVATFGPLNAASGRAKQIGELGQTLAIEHRAEIERVWPKVLRRVGGYNLDIFCNQNERPYTTDGSVNLSHLLVGSEGTLAFTKSLTLALLPLPKSKVLGVVNFPTFHQAMDAAQYIVKLGPTAVELVDRTMIELSLTNPAFAPTIRTAVVGSPDAILLVEFSGDDKGELTHKLQQLIELIGTLGLPDAVVSMVDDAPQKNLWEVRKAGLNIMMSLKGDGKPVSFIEDCAVPLESLAEYTANLTEVFAKHGTRGTWYAHASVGTLHVRPILDLRRGDATKMRAIADEASALVRKFKGAYSGEHGDGLCRGEWIEWQFGPAITGAFRQIKHAFDPDNLFNPGKMVDSPKMDDPSLFRFKPEPNGYQTIPIKTALDWRAWDVQNDPLTEAISAPGSGGDGAQGFGKAVEMCNNNGHCRKFDAGTMCPSYRVTRDESASTRGRANTLRMAVSGQLGRDGIASQEVHEALELCVSCKGCKRDCPTGVDMAKMKIEHLYQYKLKHGFSLKDNIIARLPVTAGFAAKWPNVFNLRNRKPWLARLGERLFGISAKRSLPEWRADTVWSRLPAEPVGPTLVSGSALLAAQARGEPCVVLFVDTFNGAFERENVDAAVTVLGAAGYAVHIPRWAAQGDRDHRNLCCGRTFLAVGMVDEARRQAEYLLSALVPFAQAGISIAGLEPSCLFTMKDEMLTMRLGEDAQTVADHAMMIETFLEREAKAGRLDGLRAKLKPATSPILVHGHCHQKAFAEITPTLALLSLIPGAKPSLIESSCCGMAGAFGYDAKHFDVSMQMAELSLLPAIRNAADAIIVADGTSCRHQIRDGAAREAKHAMRVLADHLS
ncbi:MAG: FAD-binding protein [Rhizobacter sp.]|nr:FAD-binding protein [Burkholderiales bacterium]